jgi:tetratricopeptide (TPR) repeat protein
VGRDQAWRELQSAWRSAEHQPVFTLIKGEAGIGKTRLAEEFLHWAQRQGITGAITRSYHAEGELAYTPITALLREEPFSAKLSSLDNIWLAEITRLLPELRIDLPELPEPERLTESWKRQRLFEACSRVVLWGEQSLVLVVDDLQWVDQESISWLHYLMDYQADAKLFILGTLRPEETVSDGPLAAVFSDLRRKGQLTEITLDRLDQEATISLADNLSDRDLDEVTAARLYRETEGNPLFIVEMVRASYSGLQEAPDRPLALPPKVQAVIETRLAVLSSAAREIADVGAVAGREFTFDLIARALEDNDDMLVQGLDELWRRRIVRDQGKDGYDFSHDKFREVLYLSLSPPRRIHLHRKVAEALEGLHQGRTSDIAHRLAHHYDQAGQGGKAIDHYIDAGDRARQLYAQQEAIDYYQRGLDLLANDENAQAVRLYEGLGASLLREAHYDAALDAYQAMRSAAAAVKDPRAQAQSWFRSCKVHDRQGRHHDALESAKRAAQLAEPIGAKEELVEAILAKGAASYRLGDPEGGIKFGREALSLSRELGDRFKIARSLNLLGQVHDMLGGYQQSQEYKEEALALFREVDDHRARWWIRTMLLNLANTVSLQGDYQAAVDLYEEALDTEVGVSDRDWEWTCLFNMAWARLEMGKYEEAERNLCDVLEQAGDSGWFGLALTHCSLAEARLELGRAADALPSAQKAVTLAKETRAQEHLGAAWRILGEVVSALEVPVQMGDKSYQAEGCFSESEEIFAEIGAEPERARTLRAWARHVFKEGDRKRGRSMWDEAREIFLRLGVTAEVESMDEECHPK